MYKIFMIITMGFFVTLSAQEKVLINSSHAVDIPRAVMETEPPSEYNHAPVEIRVLGVSAGWITAGLLTATGVVTLCAVLLAGKADPSEKQDKTTQVVVAW